MPGLLRPPFKRCVYPCSWHAVTVLASTHTRQCKKTSQVKIISIRCSIGHAVSWRSILLVLILWRSVADKDVDRWVWSNPTVSRTKKHGIKWPKPDAILKLEMHKNALAAPPGPVAGSTVGVESPRFGQVWRRDFVYCAHNMLCDFLWFRFVKFKWHRWIGRPSPKTIHRTKCCIQPKLWQFE